MKIISLAALLLAASPAAAHEFWFEAPDHMVAEGGSIEMGMFVGTDLVGQQMPYFPRAFRSLEHFAPDADGAFVAGRLGAMPAVSLDMLSEGLHVLALQSRDDSLVYSDPEKFRSFLRNEGIEHIIAEHAARGLPETGFRESYSRSAKALIGVGGAEGEDRVIGLPVELVALDNPFVTDGNIRLRFDVAGSAQASARVNLFHRSADGTVQELPLTTGADGVVTVPDLGQGFYLANAVEMVAVEESGPTVWHSHWASITWTR